MQDLINIHNYCKKFESCECCKFAKPFQDSWACRFLVVPSEWDLPSLTTACSELFYGPRMEDKE